VIDKLCEVARIPARTAIRSRRASRAAQGAGELLRAPLGSRVDPRAKSWSRSARRKGSPASRHRDHARRATTILEPNRATRSTPFGFIIAGATLPRGADHARRALLGDSLDRAMRFTSPRPTVLVVN
jgi:alanine-synthesizing transaminase